MRESGGATVALSFVERGFAMVRARLGALLVALTLVLPGNAHATSADAFVLSGSGTVYPGYDLIPEAQLLSLFGTMTVVGTDGVLARWDCAFSGNDLAGSLAEGLGTMHGGCGPLALSSCVFIRVGLQVTFECIDFGGSPVMEHLRFECLWSPSDLRPTTVYTVTCEGTYVAP